MISVKQAKQLIAANPLVMPAEWLAIANAHQLRLAEDIYSSMDIPAFAQSSMDGYAFAFDAWKPGQSLSIRGEVPAGSNPDFHLMPGEATRIFTGAPLPGGADTVVMQEKAERRDNRLVIADESLLKGLNTRPRGGSLQAGHLALTADSLLTPGALGFLAAIGLDAVKVFKRPSVAIILTGDELCAPGQPLQAGQVYESNSFALRAALQKAGIEKISVHAAKDKLEEVEAVLRQALAEADLVLVTGGVSVGDYDFVVKAAEGCGVQQIFHKIKQKPGKPLYFGSKGRQLVFGLPGNPGSVLTCFYEYVLVALRMPLLTMKAPLDRPFQKPAGLLHFVKGLFDGEKVLPLHAQESYRMNSFATANCLIQVEEETIFCKEGDLVEIHLLPT